MNKRLIWRWTKIILLLYGVLGIVLYHTQDYYLWHRKAVPASAVFRLGGQPHTELNIRYDQSTNLNLVEFRATDRPPDSPPKGVVLYFHGNRHDVEWYGQIAGDFTRKGYECWIIDYPGFGKSTNSTTMRWSCTSWPAAGGRLRRSSSTAGAWGQALRRNWRMSATAGG
jgi:pimeloyl-ACP methyl ester carboxylesterase